MSIWLAGVVPYEVVGVELMLIEQSVRGAMINSGTQFASGDTLILCLSDTPLNGWWRYLRLIHWLRNRYEIKLVVLCPEQIFLMNLFCGERIVWLNGEASLASVSKCLCCALKSKNKGIIENSEENINDFWKSATTCLREVPSMEMNINSSKKSYVRRLSLLRKLNFDSMHSLRVFMSGMKTKV